MLFARLPPALRAILALLLGVPALANGGLHLAHVVAEGPQRSDVTGLLATAAGVVLLLLAVAIPLRRRGEGTWRRRTLAAVGLVVLAYVVVIPLAVAITVTHKPREDVGDAPPGFDDVTFRAADGLRLAGWYHPSRNGAAVVVVHGGGGDRTGGQDHARLLVRHGYGVLLYDARGRGESDGSPNALGWDWVHDVEGAVRFLRARGDVGGGRIAGVGLSTGADVLVEYGAAHHDLRAIVADGTTGRTTADLPPGHAAEKPFSGAMYTFVRLLSGSSPGPPLRDLVPRVSPTPLLMIAARRGPLEHEFAKVYAAAAREPFTLWEPDAGHTAAVRDAPGEYERRVLGLLDRALR